MIIDHIENRKTSAHSAELTFPAFEERRSPVLWLVGEEIAGAGDAMDAAAHEAEQHGHLSAHLRLRGRRSHSFLGLKQLLAHLGPILRAEAPDLLRTCDTEWVTLFPEARADLFFQQTRPLDEIALPSSERRLSRESEQVFRLINRGITLILTALDQCPSLRERVLWVWVHNLDFGDRLTIHALHHLCRRSHPRVRLVASLQQMPERTSDAREAAPEGDLIRRLLNDQATFARFLAHVADDIAPDLIFLYPWSREGVQRHVLTQHPERAEQIDEISAWSNGSPVLVQALLEHGEYLADPSHGWQEAEREYLRHYRATYATEVVFSAAGICPPTRPRFLLMERVIAPMKIEPEEMRRYHRLLCERLVASGRPADWSEEEYQSHLCYHAFQGGLYAEGLDHLGKAVTPSIHWGNYENVLALLKQALRAGQQTSFAQAELVGLWKWCGLVQAYIGNFAGAMEAYQQALEIATAPATRAQLYAYLSLLATKRLADFSQAEQLLDAGLAEIAGRDDDESTVERAWLSNIRALSLFSQKQHAQAFALCKSAYDVIRSTHIDGVLHLKVNLISNMSVVMEEMGNIAGALKAWHFFRPFLQGDNQLFQKTYYYREAGLLLKQGETEQAIELFRTSYRQAEATHDAFHMDFIARDIGALYYHRQRWDDAREWFARSGEAAIQAGNVSRAQGACAARALVAWHAGQQAEACALLRDLLAGPALVPARRSRCEALLGEWQGADSGNGPQEVERKEIGWPRTKLGQPFYLIHIPAGHVIKE
ncbi:MAG TPA: tetratricopeptide repeat protein [Ktedonobacteraceae bacterium]